MKTIKTENSSNIDKEFEKELFALYKQYNRYVGSCCMVGIDKLDDAFAIDDDGNDVGGIEAVKINYSK